MFLLFLAVGAVAAAPSENCTWVTNEVAVGVPTAIVVQSIREWETPFTEADVVCIREKGAPKDVVDAAEWRVRNPPAPSPKPVGPKAAPYIPTVATTIP